MSLLGKEELVRQALSQVTGSPFELTRSTIHYVKKLKWLIACHDGYFAARAPHVTAAWEDERDDVWLRSMSIGNITGWVEDYYGEIGAIEILKMDLAHFSKSSARENLSKPFPLVSARLDAYEKILSKISSKYGVHLEIIYQAGKDFVSIHLGAKIEGKNQDLESLLQKIKFGTEALKSAYTQIRNHRNREVLTNRTRKWPARMNY